MKHAYSPNPLITTINTLSARQEEYRRQESRLSEFLAVLRANKPGTITYRVHIRAGVGAQSVMTSDMASLSKARKRAIKLWQGHNDSKEEIHVEAFVIAEGMIVPLTPAEAMAIAQSEDRKTRYKESQFMVNKDLLKPIEETVRRKHDELLYGYEKTVTKPKYKKK